MLVIEAAVDWPEDWLGWIGNFKFMALFSLDFAFQGLGVGDGGAFAGSLLAQPLLLAYAYWRAKVFFGEEKNVFFWE